MSDQTVMVGQVGLFDFITNRQFRDSLLSDYTELTTCIDQGAWKAVHVLAGSIVEALLVDSLIYLDYQNRTGHDPLGREYDLGKLIEVCKSEGILTDRTQSLSVVVKNYRNLIHPGRVIRLGEKIDRKGALTARTLVELVLEDVAARRKEKYGFTAEQIATKILKDSMALNLLRHFLKETNEYERARLCVEVLPKRYFELRSDPFYESTSDLEKCFRQTFESLTVENKRVVAKQFARMLREDDEDQVLAYEIAFVVASDLEHLDEADSGIAKEHLLSRLERAQKQKAVTTDLMFVFSGIGSHLDQQEVVRLVDILVKMILYDQDENASILAKSTLMEVFVDGSTTVAQALDDRIDRWIRMFAERGNEQAAATLRTVKEEISETPF